MRSDAQFREKLDSKMTRKKNVTYPPQPPNRTYEHTYIMACYTVNGQFHVSFCTAL